MKTKQLRGTFVWMGCFALLTWLLASSLHVGGPYLFAAALIGGILSPFLRSLDDGVGFGLGWLMLCMGVACWAVHLTPWGWYARSAALVLGAYFALTTVKMMVDDAYGLDYRPQKRRLEPLTAALMWLVSEFLQLELPSWRRTGRFAWAGAILLVIVWEMHHWSGDLLAAYIGLIITLGVYELGVWTATKHLYMGAWTANIALWAGLAFTNSAGGWTPVVAVIGFTFVSLLLIFGRKENQTLDFNHDDRAADDMDGFAEKASPTAW